MMNLFDPSKVKKRKQDDARRNAAVEEIKRFMMKHVPLPEKNNIEAITVLDASCVDPSCDPDVACDDGATEITIYWKDEGRTTRYIGKAIRDVVESDVEAAIIFFLEGPDLDPEEGLGSLSDTGKEILDLTVTQFVDNLRKLPLEDRLGFIERLSIFVEEEKINIQDEQLMTGSLISTGIDENNAP